LKQFIWTHLFSLSTEKKLELILQKLKGFKNQSNNFKAASFSVSHYIAHHGKPVFDGEYIKEVFFNNIKYLIS
jgi:hypothetical protein